MAQTYVPQVLLLPDLLTLLVPLFHLDHLALPTMATFPEIIAVGNPKKMVNSLPVLEDLSVQFLLSHPALQLRPIGKHKNTYPVNISLKVHV